MIDVMTRMITILTPPFSSWSSSSLIRQIGDANDAAMIVITTAVSDAKGATMIVIILVRYKMMLGDDQMMIKMMTRMITIIVASLASLTAVVITIIAASTASPMLPDKR